MQQVRVKDITVKAGKVKSGARMGEDYELIIIIGSDGSEFTTFDKGIKEVGIGGLLELDAVIKNNKTNITSFNIIEKGSAVPAPTPPGQPGNGMTPDAWAEKDRLERRARASNICFMGIMQLASTPNLNVNPKYLEKFERAVEFAMDYAIAHLQPKATVEAKPEVEDQGEKDWQKIIDDGKVLTPEGFTKRCKEAGIPWLDVKAILGVNNVKEIANYAQAWATVKEEADKQKESQTTTNN